MILPERKDALDECLGDAECFDYVQFRRVFDVRHMAIAVEDLVARIGAGALPRNWQGMGLRRASTDADVHKKLLDMVNSSPCHELADGVDIA